MSNRDGDWEIYGMDIDTGSISQLTDNEVPDRGARISPDGKHIAWHRGPDRRRDVWLMDIDGTEKRKLVDNSAMGKWLPDGRLVIFRDKNDTTTYIYDVQKGAEKKVWPPKNAKLKPKEIRGAKPSPDGKYFIGWSPKPRGTWLFSADGKFQKHVHGGCEGRFASDSSFIYWVMTAGTFGRAPLDGKPLDPLYKIHETHYGHTYFPNLSDNMKYLIFGSCPNDQHNHDTSDYEIFIMKMTGLKPAWNMPLRLTYDSGTDRWPDIFIPVDNTPPEPPMMVNARADGQQVTLSWTESWEPETKVSWYKVFRKSESEGERIIARVRGATYVDRMVDSESEYSYRISAVNTAGLESLPTKFAAVKTGDSPPEPPASIYATSGGKGKIRLKWSPAPEPDIVGYNLYRSGGDERINPGVISDSTYMDTGVKTDETYSYRITSLDRYGRESEYSGEISYTPRDRVSEDLVVLYDFSEGDGSVIHDRSGIKPPLNLKIKDDSSSAWLNNGNGLQLTGSNMIASDNNADKLYQTFRSKKQITIESWFSPANLNQTGPARIVSMSSDTGQRNFTLGQSGDEISIRLRTTETSGNGIPQLDTSKEVLSTRKIHVVTTYDGSVKRLYINGRLHSESQQLSGSFENWQNYPMIIGNELTGDRTWLGNIYLVAIYSRPLTEAEVRQNFEAGM